MALIVQKYGGTSVGSIDRMKAVADRIAATRAQGDDIVVVLSAMEGETSRLIELADQASNEHNPACCDLLISTGEQVSIALMSMLLADRKINAVPLCAHQIHIHTDGQHGRARILKIDDDFLRDLIAQGSVPVIAGFQGVSPAGAVTTFGRGGSDVTAAAVAAALGAASCDILTDVDGVYTADPRICDKAHKLSHISYEELLELADGGAKVVHTRAVEIAAAQRLSLRIRSSFSDDEGTWVMPEEEIMESTLISGISSNLDEAKVAIRGVPDEIGVVARIFEPIAKAGINVDLILQNLAHDGRHDLTFTVPKNDLKKALAHAEGVARVVGAGRVEAAGDIAKISVVGIGMRSHAGVAHTMFKMLAEHDIAIQMIGTSEIKVSIVIDAKFAELAVRALHEAFGLEQRADGDSSGTDLEETCPQ